MKKAFIILAAVAALAGCKGKKTEAPAAPEVVNLIMETDMGNDVDDAVAMDLIYKYVEAGKVNLLGVCLNKDGAPAGEYIDLLNLWYGYPDVPIGVIRDGANPMGDSYPYTAKTLDETEPDGTPVFKLTGKFNYDSCITAVELYRKILAAAEDNSVTIASVGFSTNLARLLETPGDKYSPLTGKELVAKKVRLLSTMAGQMVDPNFCEYNVKIDPPAARKVFSEWPTPVVTSPFELGDVVRYPATSIENDFGWTKAHPVVEAYKHYMKMPYDRQMWDPTAVIFAVEGADRFGISPKGRIEVADNGSTTFVEDPAGDRQYLTVTEEQAKSLVEYLVATMTTVPASQK